MMLLEHDAKTLLAELGLPVPYGQLVRVGDAVDATSGAVKAQVPVGGRGKAGGIKVARDAAAVCAGLDAILGMIIRGHKVAACRIEELVDYQYETYLSFTLDAGPAMVRVMMSPQGGVDIEEAHDDLIGESVALDPAAMRDAVERLSAALPDAVRGPMREAAEALIPAFFEYEALLLEINPLFIRADGSWIIGDTKLAIDENALERRPRLVRVIEENADLYPEAALKLAQGFDFVRLDPRGDIGLITTGAGLSMQLIDELVARGRGPFNFCDIRTGQFKGDPARLIQVMEWIAEGPNIKSVLINFFAGHTHLGEISRLLIQAIAAVPQLKAPITARFIGNGLEEARAIIAEAGNPIAIETDLERAIDLAIERAGAETVDA
ncbi:MAG: ATP-grasp domain-containing protein [Sphingomonas sp.]|jgi:succinyl-CoA synthetase beta subunit|uniref:ATP-grasp domain-containing protein n=1 Tax=Sphingomonas sp. TaxID=28214 RepID=UPI00356189C2